MSSAVTRPGQNQEQALAGGALAPLVPAVADQARPTSSCRSADLHARADRLLSAGYEASAWALRERAWNVQAPGSRPTEQGSEAKPQRPATAGADRYGLVTRTGSLTGETKQRKSAEIRTLKVPPREAVTRPDGPWSEPWFVDWITISQEHPDGGLPLVDSGSVTAVDEAGQLEWRTTKAVKHEGSFETSVNVKCDGFRVTVSGNLSRFGRKENLFGFGIWDVLDRVNALLAHYSLPPMTPGEKLQRFNKGDLQTYWTGARISRLDMTSNFETGSMDNAHALMQYLGSQHAGRQSGRVLGQGETVDFGAGSKRQYWKAYIKNLELKLRGCEDERVLEYCEKFGIVRFEGTIRSRALTDMGAAWLGDYFTGWAMKQLSIVFNERTEVLTRAEKHTDDLDDLPRHLRATARDYLAGMDVSRSLSRATFYRHRNDLLSYGIDIAVRNVVPFRPRVRVIELKRAEVPSWYQLVA